MALQKAPAGDPIVAEVRQIKERLAARYDYDPEAMLREAMRRQKRQRRKVVNLSSSGMLIETETSFERGEEISVTLNLGGQRGTVMARAEVVRLASSARGEVEGVGVRFLGFVRDGEEKLAAVLDEALADPLVN